MDFRPYVFFYGRCDEALAFYEKIFAGTVEIKRNDEGPMAEHVPPDFKGKVMHAKFESRLVKLFASDGREAKTVDPEEGNISLALETGSAEEGDRIFAQLADGGAIVMPLEEAFWGGRFGMINDRFGVQWLVTSP